MLLPQIMRTIRASPHKQTGKTANFMTLGREVRLPEHLMYGPAASDTTPRERYAAELADRMEEAHDKLKRQQLQLRTGATLKQSTSRRRRNFVRHVIFLPFHWTMMWKGKSWTARNGLDALLHGLETLSLAAIWISPSQAVN